METAQVVWLVLVVVFVLVESVTIAVVSIWFALGSLAALLLSLFLPGAYLLQVAVFLLVSMLALLALRPLTRRLIGNRRTATNADAAIGKSCQVITEIKPGLFGRVKLEGQEWTAKSDTPLPVNSWCRVDAIEGVKLVVSPTVQP